MAQPIGTFDVPGLSIHNPPAISGRAPPGVNFTTGG
jgi:hypothetical protein